MSLVYFTILVWAVTFHANLIPLRWIFAKKKLSRIKFVSCIYMYNDKLSDFQNLATSVKALTLSTVTLICQTLFFFFLQELKLNVCFRLVRRILALRKLRFFLFVEFICFSRETGSIAVYLHSGRWYFLSFGLTGFSPANGVVDLGLTCLGKALIITLI